MSQRQQACGHLISSALVRLVGFRSGSRDFSSRHRSRFRQWKASVAANIRAKPMPSSPTQTSRLPIGSALKSGTFPCLVVARRLPFTLLGLLPEMTFGAEKGELEGVVVVVVVVVCFFVADFAIKPPPSLR